MEDKKCMVCREPLEGGIPICQRCKVGFKDSTDPVTKQKVIGFTKLAAFLNGFEGDKGDLVYLIKSEISNRQSLIISSCKVVEDVDGHTLDIEAPEGNQLAKRKLEEIHKLYDALNIIKKHYGG